MVFPRKGVQRTLLIIVDENFFAYLPTIVPVYLRNQCSRDQLSGWQQGRIWGGGGAIRAKAPILRMHETNSD